MSGEAFLNELESAGIRLRRDDGDLLAEIRPGATLDPYRERIRHLKPALLAALYLREQLIAAATTEPDRFDRPAYDALWRRWHEENDG